MALGLILLGTAVGGATYLYAKSKETSNGSAAVAGVATGAGAAGAAFVLSAIWPVLLAVGIIGVPAYYLGKSSKGQKALGRGD